MNTQDQPPGEAAHTFLTRLCGLLDDGEASDTVWNYCIENAKSAQSDAARVFNLAGNRQGKDEVLVSKDQAELSRLRAAYDDAMLTIARLKEESMAQDIDRSNLRAERDELLGALQNIILNKYIRGNSGYNLPEFTNAERLIQKMQGGGK